MAILRILKEEGFINEYKEIKNDTKQGSIKIYLKYSPLKQQIINKIDRVSKSSRHIYKKAEAIGKVLGGVGIAIYSTSKGILSDRECRRLKVGGELLCIVT